MPDQSIRGHIASLVQHGEIVRFTKEVDPSENLSAISWKTYSQLGKSWPTMAIHADLPWRSGHCLQCLAKRIIPVKSPLSRRLRIRCPPYPP